MRPGMTRCTCCFGATGAVIGGKTLLSLQIGVLANDLCAATAQRDFEHALPQGGFDAKG